MKKKKYIVGLVVIVVLAVGVLALQKFGHAKNVSSTTGIFQSADSEGLAKKFSAKGGYDNIKIQAKGEITEGTIKVTVTDPKGNNVWESSISKDNASEVKEFKTIAGDWKINVTPEKANGKFTIDCTQEK
jgi:methionine-rich copper-binding protein CopC